MIGIIGAMTLEVENLVNELTDKREETVAGIHFYLGNLCGKDVVLAVCGVGKCFAAMCAQTMIVKYSPSLVINIGVAGALSSDLKVGDMAIATAAVQHDMDTSAIGDPIGLISGINMVYLPCDEALGNTILACGEKLGYNTKKGIVASGDQFVADMGKKISFVFLINESISHCRNGLIIASNNAKQAEMQPTTVAMFLNVSIIINTPIINNLTLFF